MRHSVEMCVMAAAFVVAISMTKAACGYDVETHAAISSAAAGQSAGLTSVLSRLGLRSLRLDDRRQMFVNSEGSALPIDELIQFGSRWEDDVSLLQALRHFYDPVNDRPLDLGGTASAFVAKSPDWSLEDATTFTSQLNSYRDAREYLYKAITESSATERRKYFGLMFQSVGHVIHHLQDMAQPQHVRNDPHCDSKWCQAAAILAGNPILYAPSAYEKYTNLDSPNSPYGQVRRNLPYFGNGSEPVYPGANAANTPFKTPRDFWRTSAMGSDIGNGKGISEYTNRNFFSAGTLFGQYASPHAPTVTDWYNPSEIVDIQSILPGTSLRGTVHFFGTQINDSLAGSSQQNKRAVTDSLLDGDLAQIYSSTGNQGYLIFALNRFTYDAAHQFLIPRAVAYSAGFINYFFRGQLRISLPDQGMYGIVDHAVPEGNDPQSGGFATIKLKLQNTTPGGTDAAGNEIVEPMGSGAQTTLIAIAKFHRNICYRADLGGEYGSPGIDWRQCRSPTEEIAISDPAAVPVGINAGAQAVTFVFPNKIPISATDLYLQVVYRGPLGEEQDAVVVETKDLSEPTYLYNYSRWDQYTYACPWPALQAWEGNFNLCRGTPYSYAEWCASGGFPSLDACNQAMGYTTKLQFSPDSNPIPGYDPANPPVPQGEFFDISRELPFNAVAVLPAPVGTLARVAVLTDASPSNIGLVILEARDPTHNTAGFQWFTGSAYSTTNQLDVATNTLTPSVTYAPGRGVFLPSDESFLLNSGVVHPPLLLVPSPINF